MMIKNSEQRFGIITILFHWLMAILIIGLLALGVYMTRIPISATKLKLYGLHKEFGVLALFLVFIRIVWRIININPSLSSLPRWERIAARAMHYLFYLLMFAVPISGWLLTSSAGLPVSFFGLFILPDVVAANDSSLQLYIAIHKWLAYGLMVAITGHIAAALKHHFINKDDILRRMVS